MDGQIYWRDEDETTAAESLQTIAERIITIISFLTCGTQGVFALSGAGIIKTVRYCKQFHLSKMVYAKLS